MMKEEFMNMKKLYHYTKFDTAIKILESHSLRFGRLHNMNDIHENDKLPMSTQQELLSIVFHPMYWMQ